MMQRIAQLLQVFDFYFKYFDLGKRNILHFGIWPHQLSCIRIARALGFSIDEIRDLLHLWADGKRSSDARYIGQTGQRLRWQ